MKTQRSWGRQLVLGLVAAVLFLTGCSTAKDPWADVPGDGPKVLVSFTPLYCFAKKVGGDHAQVLCLAVTIGPHDFKPEGADALKAYKADLLLVNGLGLDDWFTKIKNSANNKKLKVVEIGSVIEKEHHELMHPHDESGGDDEPAGKDGGHHHDPHLWLGVPQAKGMVDIICKALSEVAPEHKSYYEDNARNYKKELDELHRYGKEKLKGKKQRVIVTHDSMLYFKSAFGVKVVGHLMPQPGTEADSKKLADLVKLCSDEKKPVGVVTVEPQYSKATAETLIEQLKKHVDPARVPTLVTFDTLETAPRDFDADYYVTTMRSNIDALAKVLK